MDKAEFIATLIKLQEMENPNFKRDEFLIRENYFVGYESEKQKYFERKRKKK